MMWRWILIALLMLSTATEAATPRCVVLTFTDDTRYDQIRTTEILSARVVELLSDSGKINVTLKRALDADIEAMLYDERVRGWSIMQAAMSSGDFTPLFEGMFDERHAQSIATAQVGQIISPEITKALGVKYKADYLIQGTIINLGVGNWWSEDYSEMSNAINMASTFTGMNSSTNMIGMSGPLGNLAGFDVTKTGIGVQCDVRLIKAETGEVIWCKRMLGLGTQKLYDTGIAQFGKKKLNDKLRLKAIETVANKIVDELIADLDARKLFLR